MNEVVVRIRTFFHPLLEVVVPVSARSWILLMLGTSFVSLVRPYLEVSVVVMALLSVPLVAAFFSSIVADFTRQRSETWVTAVVLAWILGLMVVSMLRVPTYRYHDELLLTRVALTGIEQGINPYSRDFRQTEFDSWIGNAKHESWIHGHHPAATTYVYLPGHLIQSMLLYQITITLLHWYDQRLLYIVVLAVVFFLLWRALRRSPAREPLLLLFALNPFMVMNFYGLNEWTMLLWLLVAALLLVNDRPYFAAASLGIALATKQLSAVAALFLLPLLLTRLSQAGRSRSAAIGILLLTTVFLVVPFVVWSPRDFVEDTLGFFLHDVTYPMGGEGIGGLLLKVGVVGPADPFPFWIFQIIFAVPMLIALGRWLLRNQSVRNALLATGLGFAVVGFFWRYFLPAHAITSIVLLMVSYLIGEAERTRAIT